MKRKSVVLLSGGLDSAANLALCAALDEPVLALTARYGQRAAEPEVRASAAFARYYGVRHEVVDLAWLGRPGYSPAGRVASALTDPSMDVPEIAPGELDRMEVARETAGRVWVPNRNGALINVAAAYAEREGASLVVVGFNREEAATFPDNTSEFMAAATAALAYSTRNGTRVASYTDRLDKREIVARLRGLERRFPFELVWSCYHGGEKPCGGCESCRRHDRAVAGGGDNGLSHA